MLKACLDSLLRIDPPPAEIILVSDGEKVTLPEVEQGSRIIHLSTGIQSGPAVARNLGARYATFSLLCFIDSDIVVPPDLITMIQHEFRTNPEIDALFGSYDTEPFMPNFLSQYRNLLHHYVHQTGSEEAFTFWSGCGAVRRGVFMKMDGFDGERFPRPAIEDIELGYRLKNAGHPIRLCKNIQVKHLKKWEPFSMIKVDFFQRALPWTTLLLSEDGFTNDLNLKLSSRLSVGAVFLLVSSLILAFWNPFFLLLAIPVLLAFLMLNFDLYKFFYRQKGWWFTLKVIPWHSIFYLISGLAFVLGLTSHYLTRNHG